MARFARGTRKKEKRNKLILGIIVIVIMVGGGLGVINRGQGLGGNRVDYGDFKFYQQQNKWVTEIDKTIVAFNFHPLEVEYLNLSEDINKIISNATYIYSTNDPTSINREYIALARYEFSEIFMSFFNRFVVNAFTVNVSSEVPVITCDNATDYAPVIYFLDSNQTRLSLDNNCVLLEAESFNDYFRLVDRLLYGLLGIIE